MSDQPSERRRKKKKGSKEKSDEDVMTQFLSNVKKFTKQKAKNEPDIDNGENTNYKKPLEPAPSEKIRAKKKSNLPKDEAAISTKSIKKKKKTEAPDMMGLSMKKRRKKKKGVKGWDPLDDDVDPREKRRRAEELERPSADQKERFNRFIEDVLSTGVEGLAKEYETEVRRYFPPSPLRSAFDSHLRMNRYTDIICLDLSRVVLTGGGNDYIHANYVKGEPFINTFICTQGPLEATVVEFWRMVVQERVGNIFMLCEIFEAGKKKSEKYWPDTVGSSVTFGQYTISCKEVDTRDLQFKVTTLRVDEAGGGDPGTVFHYHWNTWPDRGVPPCILTVFRLLRLARTSRFTSVVHCSAGIGRTGVVVAIELLLERMTIAEPFKMMNLIKHLRSMRSQAVQTDVQYVYLAMSICYYCKEMGIMKAEYRLPFAKFTVDYENLVRRRTGIVEGSGAPRNLQQCTPQNAPANSPATSPVSPAQSPVPGMGCAKPSTSPGPNGPQVVPQYFTLGAASPGPGLSPATTVGGAGLGPETGYFTTTAPPPPSPHVTAHPGGGQR